MVAEIALGRTSKSSFVDAYETIGNKIKAKKTIEIYDFYATM